MRLGILYAMEKEADRLLKKLEATPLETPAGMPIYALPGNHVLCVGGVGKVNAAMAAQLLIDHHQVDAICNAGCAGAFSDLAVGTIVIAEHCVQHDVDTTLAGDPPGFVSTVAVTQFPCAAVPLEDAVSGVVATGDWFGRDLTRAERIRDTYHATVCDMEGAAVAQVCLRNGVDCMVIKSVSDHLFAPDQDVEYQENFARAMDALDAAVAAILQQLED